ncbi:beta-eliminating lyase [Mycena pura]|uniref:Beta-eliminating lyase n=1 Tax=Mycena pura TaxID=153505 RepID=A0AAD6V9J9_9AGAR|nr:beta-eliminating lyase [Mycena pura]
MDEPLMPPAHNVLVVHPHISITPEERETILRSVEYNVFAFSAALVTCDFLSDSGTTAMTDVQWAAMLRGDESYGRNSGYYCLLDAFRDVFERGDNQEYLFRDVLAGTIDSRFYLNKFLKPQSGGFVNGGPVQLIRPNFFVVPQGRCAEFLLFSTMANILEASRASARATSSDTGRDEGLDWPPVIISNGFFDTTSANASVAGFELHAFLQPGLTDPFPIEKVSIENPFRGNLDVAAASAFLSDPQNAKRTALILLTITNNWAAGQPVSMANIEATAALARQHGIPLFFDACRFAENAAFIQTFERGYSHMAIAQIVVDMFAHADGFTISLKKDGLANMGGALCFRDEGVFASRFAPDIGIRLKERQIVCYGNDSYGGMSGRDLMAAAVGLHQVTQEAYLRNRIGQVRRFAQRLVEKGVPVLLPPGGSAVFLDMDGFFADCGRSYGEFAAVGFTLELLCKYGIRSAEAGPFGWEWDKKTSAKERDLIPNLVRLAVPRNVMTDVHFEYTAAAIGQLYMRRHTIPGARITRGAELRIRHFQSGLEPVPVHTFLGKAQDDIARLSAALGLDQAAQKILAESLAFSMKPWGQVPIHEQPTCGWLSDCSYNHSPVEYSVAIEQNTGKSQLRFMIEAQAAGNSIEAYQRSALDLTKAIGVKYLDVPPGLDRFNAISDLFFPLEAAQGPLAAWHSLVMDTPTPRWKIYLNPRASGPARASDVVRDALFRLGMPDAHCVLETVRSSDPHSSSIYFSLDLHPKPHDRVKVYLAHHNCSAASLAGLIAPWVPGTAPEAEVHRFFSTLAGSDGPYDVKSPITCFAFTRPDGEGTALKTEVTVHFPLGKQRLEARDAVLTLHHETAAGVEFFQWVGLKLAKSRGPVVTFYFGPDMFSGLARGG